VVASGLLGAGLTLLIVRRVWCAWRFLSSLVLRDRLLEVFQSELQLIRADLFGPAAEPMAQQALDQQPQLIILGVQFRVLPCRRADHLAQHLLQQRGIVGQHLEIDLHAAIMDNALASVPGLSIRIGAFPNLPIRACDREPERATRIPLAASRAVPSKARRSRSSLSTAK
jgi:hypothetical protein